MKRSQLKEMIREVVREVFVEELKEQINSQIKRKINTYTPLIVKEISEDIITDSLNEMVGRSSTPPRKHLAESVRAAMYENEDWPTLSSSDIHKHAIKNGGSGMDNRHKVAALMSGGGPYMGSVAGEITVDMTLDEAGHPRPVQGPIPDSLRTALNKDYSGYVAAMNRATAQGRGV